MINIKRGGNSSRFKYFMAGAGSIFYTYLRRIATICTLGKEISWCA